MIKESTLIDSRYIIVRNFANGGMAEIYEANDIFFHRPVAIKIIKESELNDENIRLFRNEINIASSFNDSHIFKIYNVGVYNQRPFMVYELMTGYTMKEVLDQRGSFSLPEIKTYMSQLIDTIAVVHSRNISHNDIKPANLIYLHDGTIKLVDFGIASHMGERFTKCLATAQYLAPEVIDQKAYSKESDIYSLGITLFEFFTGRTPYMKSNSREEVFAHMHEKMPSISRFASLSNYKKIDKIIENCTNIKPKKRYKDLMVLKKDIMELEG